MFRGESLLCIIESSSLFACFFCFTASLGSFIPSLFLVFPISSLFFFVSAARCFARLFSLSRRLESSSCFRASFSLAEWTRFRCSPYYFSLRRVSFLFFRVFPCLVLVCSCFFFGVAAHLFAWWLSLPRRLELSLFFTASLCLAGWSRHHCSLFLLSSRRVASFLVLVSSCFYLVSSCFFVVVAAH